jgi:hypothetical protein
MQKARQTLQKMQGKKIIHFLHIGKTGGSAIKYVLKNNLETNHYVIYLHPHDVGLSDIPKGEGIVFFVRDPISKFISGFYSRQRQGRPKYFSPWSQEEKAAFEYFTTPNHLASAISSEDTQEQARARAAMQSIKHVKDSYWNWFMDETNFNARRSDIFFIGSQERLSQDFKSLKEKLGLGDYIVLPQDDINAHKNPSGLDKHLDKQAIENLKAWYKNDFDFIRLCQSIRDDKN